MVSFLGPQHARLFYAHMEGITLVIRQSKLYSLKGGRLRLGTFLPVGY